MKNFMAIISKKYGDATLRDLDHEKEFDGEDWVWVVGVLAV